MTNLYWLSDDRIARFLTYFPKNHGAPRVVGKLYSVIFQEHDCGSLLRAGLNWNEFEVRLAT